MRWYSSGFSMGIYSAQNIDSDRRNMIFFGDLPLRQAEKMIMLKKENPSKYSEFFEKIIYELEIMDKLNLIVENNFYIHDRLPIISAATTLFMEKQGLSWFILPKI